VERSGARRSVVGSLPDHGPGVYDAEAFGTGPIALQFQEILHRRNRLGARCHHSVHGTFMRLCADIAACIRNYENFEPLIESRQCGAGNADRRPQASNDDAALTDGILLQRAFAALEQVVRYFSHCTHRVGVIPTEARSIEGNVLAKAAERTQFTRLVRRKGRPRSRPVSAKAVANADMRNPTLMT
jgi:hypothetical protein